jgi:hypothetical protein
MPLPVTTTGRRVRVGTAVAGALFLVAAACGSSSSGTGSGAPSAGKTGTGTSPRPDPKVYHDQVTGLRTTKAQYERPALSVKIDNAPQARPQAGLDHASLVFEVLVEGGLTRLLAVFHAPGTYLLGPVRSARPVDGALLRALNGGIFAFSGAAKGEIAPAQAYSHADFIDADLDDVPYFGVAGRVAPQDTFTTPSRLYAEAARLHYHEPPPPQLFDFSAAPRGGSRRVHAASVYLSTYSYATWTYDPTTRRYLRAEDGTPHITADGRQISAADVVLMYVKVDTTNITDAAGNEDPFDLAYGSGQMTVLRNGVEETGHWSRPTVADKYTFTSSKGGPLPLKAGNIWVELVPHGGPFPTYGAVHLTR